MKLADILLKKINRKYEPSSTFPLRFGKNDLVLKTDDEGYAVQMFIGKMNDMGVIKGDRYSRTLVRDREGKIIKDHWERKGKAT